MKKWGFLLMAKTMSKCLYLSYPLNRKTPAYGGGDSLKIQQEKRIEKGDSCNTKYWSLSNHLDTHIDYPGHFVQAGKTSSDYCPDFWNFHSPFILDISPVEPGLILRPETMEMDALPNTIDMLVIKTGYRISPAGRGC